MISYARIRIKDIPYLYELFIQINQPKGFMLVQTVNKKITVCTKFNTDVETSIFAEEFINTLEKKGGVIQSVHIADSITYIYKSYMLPKFDLPWSINIEEQDLKYLWDFMPNSNVLLESLQEAGHTTKQDVVLIGKTQENVSD